MTEGYVEEIPPALANERVDRVVALIGDLSRAGAVQIIDAGGVQVDKQTITKSSQKVKAGQVIEFVVPEVAEVEIRPQAEVEFEVTFEDDQVIVVNKPAKLVVHPGAGIIDGTLINGLINRYPEIREVGQSGRPGIVHRLDSGTTGLLVVARTQEAYESLVAQLSAHKAQRSYVALAHGLVESAAGTIDAPIGRSSRDRTKMGVAVGGKESRTHYVVKEKFVEPSNFSLLDLELETGRTHQIRVHLSAIGHPVVGDETYGGAKGPIKIDRPLLHAARLSFSHPISGETGEFSAALPDDFSQILAELRENRSK